MDLFDLINGGGSTSPDVVTSFENYVYTHLFVITVLRKTIETFSG